MNKSSNSQDLSHKMVLFLLSLSDEELQEFFDSWQVSAAYVHLPTSGTSGRFFAAVHSSIQKTMSPRSILETWMTSMPSEVELEENIRRSDLTWPERVLRGQPTGGDFTTTSSPVSEHARARLHRYSYRRPIQMPTKTPRARTHAGTSSSRGTSATPMSSKLRRQMEAFKILNRKEEVRRNVELGESMSKTFSRADHTLILDESLRYVEQHAVGSHPPFDVICTDPPYGIDAQDFNDSAGKVGGSHLYDDSPTNWRRLMEPMCALMAKVTRPDAQRITCSATSICSSSSRSLHDHGRLECLPHTPRLDQSLRRPRALARTRTPAKVPTHSLRQERSQKVYSPIWRCTHIPSGPQSWVGGPEAWVASLSCRSCLQAFY